MSVHIDIDRACSFKNEPKKHTPLYKNGNKKQNSSLETTKTSLVLSTDQCSWHLFGCLTKAGNKNMIVLEIICIWHLLIIHVWSIMGTAHVARSFRTNFTVNTGIESPPLVLVNCVLSIMSRSVNWFAICSCCHEDEKPKNSKNYFVFLGHFGLAWLVFKGCLLQAMRELSLMTSRK